MRKILSFVVMSLFLVLPFTVSAASEIIYDCGNFDANGVRTCTVAYKIDEATPQNSVTVTLTEHGGAQILSVDDFDGEEFQFVGGVVEADGVWTASLQTIDPTAGEYNLLTFKYQNSGLEDCKVTIGIGNDNKDVETEDTPTENVQTGSSLPYIALGTIALIAVGAYLKTKNKAKMYKI